MPKGASSNSRAFSHGVWGAIGDDSVDGAVDDALTDGLGIFLGTQRRIDLERGVVGPSRSFSVRNMWCGVASQVT